MTKFVTAQGRKVRAVNSCHELEALEQRRLFAVSWDGGGDGVNWSDANNWSGDVVPGDNDDVTIAAGAGTILVSGASQLVKSVSSSRAIAISGTQLTVSGAVTLGAASRIDGGGALDVAGNITLNAALTLGSDTDNSNGDLYTSGAAAQTLSGTGSITAAGNDVDYLINAGTGSLTIVSGFNISGRNLNTFSPSGAAIINNGVLNANVPAGSWAVSGITTNAGTLTATSGAGMVITGALTNTGLISATTNGFLQLNSTVTGAGTVSALSGGTLNMMPAYTNSSTLTVSATSTLFAGNNLINAGTLSVAGTLRVAGTLTLFSGTATMPAGGTGVIKTAALSVAAGRQLNLNDNDLIVDYTGSSVIGSWNGANYTGLTGLIQAGRSNGTWTGNGIVTGMSAAKDPNTLTNLGIAESSLVLGLSGTQTTFWDGVTVDATAVLIKYTYTGDANLDGVINGDDYFQVDSAFPSHARGWANGDFNYDGLINGDDYFFIDSDFPAQKSPL